MTPKINETGIVPPGYIGTRIEAQLPLRDQLSRWYFGPLRKLEGHDAFVAMILSLILVEKWLRVTRGFGDQDFSKGSKPIREFGDLFGVDPDTAFDFWQDWRNGLLHRAMPKSERFDGYAMSAKFPKPLQLDGREIQVNPWLFRKRVLEIMEPDRDLWTKDPQCPLAKEFREVEPI